jgi:glycosyltransferase involved in cell wall biosynthesis
MRILVVEPYYGGSHKAFLDGLLRELPHAVELLTLPARHWKWRMRLAAPYFADLLCQRAARDGQIPDAIFCSAFIDAAVFRGMLLPRLAALPLLVYFHENQFAYPVQVHEERDVHFALTNLTSALAADRIAFNSRYNLETFLAGAGELLARMEDMALPGWETALRAKAVVLHPGLDFADIDASPVSPPGKGPPVLLWNHRWEHDKDPDFFFHTLFALAAEGLDFRLIVLGQSFRAQPPVFAEAARRLAKQIIHFGYARKREEYCQLLHQADVAVSTARHEFYGMAVLEAVRAGCRPLVPDRLSYQELFPVRFRYRDEEFAQRLRQSLEAGRLPEQEAREFTAAFSWSALRPDYLRWFSAQSQTGFCSPAESTGRSIPAV